MQSRPCCECVIRSEPNADACPPSPQGLELKQQLHQSVEEQYNTEKMKYQTVQRLNKSAVMQRLNGGRGMPYQNLRMG